MTTNLRLLVLVLGVLGGSADLQSSDKTRTVEVAEVAVSAANYFADETRAVVAATRQKTVNPVALKLNRISPPQRYIMVPGEEYEADRNFPEICAALEPALANKGFLNAADARGIVREPDAIDLVLRISYGDRTWRVPAVRARDLTWKSGLATTRSSPFMAGSTVMWDRRAGGNDDTWSQLIKLINTNGGKNFDVEPAAASAAQLETRKDGMTRVHHLLVVDAFSFRDLQEKGARAKRRWSTFIAVPQRADETFGEVMATMLRVGTPYFGETTEGPQVFNDARASIDLGTPKIIESDVRARPD